MQPGEGAVEVGDPGEEGRCAALEEVQAAVGSLGLRANPHCAALVAVHPDENQRLSGWMGWVGLGQEVGGWCWSTVKERGLCFSGIIFKSSSDNANKQTYL